MKKTEIVDRLRSLVRNQLSPTRQEQYLVTNLFEAVKAALQGTCLLSGSYARFTASRPLHDLDLLFVAGRFDPQRINPSSILTQLQDRLVRGFRNPTQYKTVISPQSHSISISFENSGEEKFAVDIVPAFTSGLKNNFGQDIYWVPEIARTSRRNRRSLYEKLEKSVRPEADWWIKTDPTGYINDATELNSRNPDFRKAVKFAKRWKFACKELDKRFALKSFHLEQAIYGIQCRRPQLDVFDALFKFFCDIPALLSDPQISDRADSNRFIDEYVAKLGQDEKQKIVEARDCFLIALENLPEGGNVETLLQGGFHRRASDAESYLFDIGIPVFVEPSARLRITAQVLPRAGFRPFVLGADGRINIDRQIQFRARLEEPHVADLLKWKVKNDNSSPQPRGEITDHRTRNDPEKTVYDGNHYVECYAIRGGNCIARARQNVAIRRSA